MKVRIVSPEVLAQGGQRRTLAAAIAQLRAELAAVRAENAELRTTVAQLRAENTALRATVARLEAENTALRTENAQLRAEQARLQEQVQTLQARVGRNSSNSSQPPSSDPPQVPPPAQGQSSGRRRGGQPGHEAHERLLVPAEQVDEIVDHWPRACQRCQAPLAADPLVAAGEPERHQVTELPPVRARVTEHRLQCVRCPACGTETRAALPPDIPRGAFGPRLQATVAVLSGRYRLSRREVAAVCDDVLGAPVSVGSVDGLCQATAAALATPVAELAEAVHDAAVAHADETSWAQAGQRRWLWVVVTAVATVFTVAASRGRGVIQGLLGTDFAGYLVSDRWSAYTWLVAEHRQVCWAHLKRDFQALVDWGGAARPVGLAALALIDQMFAAWHEPHDDPAGRARLAATLAPVQASFQTLLEAGTTNPAGKTAGLCRALLKLWPALWTFVTVPGVEPTNNAAERAIRPAVLWRRGSFGSQSDDGARFVERMLTVTATCNQQGRSPLDYLTAVCTAAQHGQPIPSLLPGPLNRQRSIS